jgi:hypothetical protein
MEPAQNGGSFKLAPQRISGFLSCFGARICRLYAIEGSFEAPSLPLLGI